MTEYRIAFKKSNSEQMVYVSEIHAVKSQQINYLKLHVRNGISINYASIP